MSGGSSTQKTQTSNQPYKAAQPLMDKGMGDAMTLYKNGGLVKPQTMSTVVPYANQTIQGMDAIQNQANAALAPGGVTSQFQDIINNGGYNANQMTALDGIRNTATGEFDINSNPAYAGIRQRAMDAARDAVSSQASAMGRSGSPVNQGVLAREVGNVAADMDVDEYRNWQTRQGQAQRDLFTMGQAGMDNLDPAYASMQTPAQDLMGIGSKYEDLAGRQLNDHLRIAQERQNLPLANIQALLAAAAGAGGYGTQTQTAQGPSNTMSNIAGGLLGGASLLSYL